MSISIQDTSCCGMHEIENLSEFKGRPKDALSSLLHASQYDSTIRGSAYIIFSGVREERYGQEFAALIKKYKLGTITKAPAKKNLNSGNVILAWIWTLDRRAIQKWAEKHRHEM